MTETIALLAAVIAAASLPSHALPAGQRVAQAPPPAAAPVPAPAARPPAALTRTKPVTSVRRSPPPAAYVKAVPPTSRTRVELRKAEVAARRQGSDPRAQAEALTALARAQMVTGDPRGALVNLNEAVLLQARLPERSAELATRIEIGRTHVALRDDGAALASFRTALDEARGAGALRREGSALAEIGAVEARAGRVRDARRAMVSALPAFRAVKDRAGEAVALGELAELTAEDSPGAASALAKQSLLRLAAVRSSLHASPASVDPEERLEYVRSAVPTARRVARLLIEQESFEDAFGAILELKSHELHRVLGRPTAPQGHAIKQSAQEMEVARRYDERVLRSARLGEARAASARRAAPGGAGVGRRGVSLEEEAASTELVRFLRSSECALDRTKPLRDARSLRTVLAQIDPLAAAIVTIATDDALLAMVVTSKDTKGYTLPIGGEELAEKVRSLRAALADPEHDAHAAAGELYQAVLAPIAPQLEAAGAKTIVFWPDGPLRYVPMATLWSGCAWVAQQYRTVVMTAASLALMTLPANPSWTASVLGATRGDEELPPLEWVDDEVAAVVGRPPERGALQGTALLDEAFTEDAMRGALASGRQVLHVATHYGFRPADPDAAGGSESFLLLGDKKRLPLSTIDGMSFGGLELAVFSACNTALGVSGAPADVAGSEVDGLAEVVQQKGAKAVLATMWSVDDASTAALMREFYRRHAEPPGAGKIAALQAAQLAMIGGQLGPAGAATSGAAVVPAVGGAGAPGRGAEEVGHAPAADWAHPYYWGPFVLIGNWR